VASRFEVLLQHKGLLHDLPGPKLAQLQGEVFGLYLASERHRGTPVSEFATWVFPAIHFNQFRIYRNGTRPIGWISWALMSDQDARGYMAGNFDFTIATWKSGTHLWFIDFIAPFGHAQRIAEDMKNNVFPDQIGFAPDVDAEDGSKRVRRFFGANVKGTDAAEAHVDFLKPITH
jgi:cytolysin-activating lysine-acyltransferase